MFMGDAAGAYEQFQTAVKLWRKTGDLRLTAFGLNYLSLAALAVSKHDEASLALQESISINSAVGDRWGLGIAYRGLGLVEQAQGQHTRRCGDGLHARADIGTGRQHTHRSKQKHRDKDPSLPTV